MTEISATPAAVLSAEAPDRYRRPSIWRKLRRDRAAMLASGFLAIVIALGLLAPWIAPYDPYDNNLRNMLKPPSAAFWLGNDGQGRDLFSRLLYGIRTTLSMGLIAVGLGGSIGAVLGLLAAYFRRLEGPIMRVVDVLLSFPSILFGLAIAAVLGAGTFSITIALPDVELELRKSILNPAIFHQITLNLPGLHPWTNSTRSEPTSKVFGMGNLVSRWRDLVIEGKPATHGYFALGDTLIRTNPLYGRGCSFAAVGAQLLRRTLDETAHPARRAILLHQRLEAELRPFYLTQRRQDRSAIKRARETLTPGFKPKLKARLMQSFIDDGIRIAVRSDVRLLREAMRGFHMLEHPDKWLGKPNNLATVLYYWARGRKLNAAAYPPSAGPERQEMMQALNLDYRADLIQIPEETRLAA